MITVIVAVVIIAAVAALAYFSDRGPGSKGPG